MLFHALATKEGGLNISPRIREQFVKALKQNAGARLEISFILPESKNMRGYFEGALVGLVTFYQEGLDHRNHEDCAKVRGWLKEELFCDLVALKGKTHRVAKSTKGRRELSMMIERTLDWITENYAPPPEAINPEAYKTWRDTIFPNGGPDNYIDYLVAKGDLKA